MSLSSDRGRILPPDLDDRTWQDLVDELRALIPQYAPAWTDHNPSDIGITLIELFAWLAESLIYRLNQVPDKNYVAFLNLLGITRDPAIPAHTYLTFTSGTGPVLAPAGTQASVPAAAGDAPVVFETDEDVRVLPVSLRSALLIGPYAAAGTTSQYVDVTGSLVGPPAARLPLILPVGQDVQICLGFDQASAEEISLGFRPYLAGPDPGQITVSWLFSQAGAEPLAWPAIPGAVDGTQSLLHDGTIQLSVPATWAGQRPSTNPATPADPGWTTVTAAAGSGPVTDKRFWIGLRIVNNAGSQLAIGIDRILFNAASASTALTVRTPEVLGESTGQPFLTFALANRPLYRVPGGSAPYSHLVVQVGTEAGPDPAGWQEWALVDEMPDGAGTCYRLNPVTGEIIFGDHDERSGRGFGSIPPAGTRIRALTYRYVAAGAAGNVAAGQITGLVTAPAGAILTGITRVTNLGPGMEGSDEEPIEATLRRAPEDLKVRNRAVTAGDYEFLGQEARNDILISSCLTPRAQTANGPGIPPAWQQGDPWAYAGIIRAPGTVNLVIVPDQGPLVARPESTRLQLSEVQAYLDDRRDVTAHLQVLGPRYLPVIAQVNFVIWQQAIDAGANPDAIEEDIRGKVVSFLHPTYGGIRGTGWQLGQAVFTANLFQVITLPADLGYVSDLQVRPDIPVYHFPPLNRTGTATNFNAALERPFPLSALGPVVRVADYELVCSADPSAHVINSIQMTQV